MSLKKITINGGNYVRSNYRQVIQMSLVCTIQNMDHIEEIINNITNKIILIVDQGSLKLGLYKDKLPFKSGGLVHLVTGLLTLVENPDKKGGKKKKKLFYYSLRKRCNEDETIFFLTNVTINMRQRQGVVFCVMHFRFCLFP